MIPTSWLTADCLAAASGAPPRARSIQVFRNDLVDRWLARAHPAFPAVFFGPIAAVAFALSSRHIGTVEALAAFLGGWLFFSLFEYALHRFVFHGDFPETLEGRVAWFLTHGYHHVYPNDADRLVLPPIGSLPLAVLFLAAYVLILGTGIGLGAFAGTVAGYIVYDSVHYVLHHRQPRTALGAWLRRYHMLHHHSREPSRYGVSSPLWDLVFRTYTPVRRAARATGPAGRLSASGGPDPS
jgi:sterol desaturase/sphingolipid hydroxylase (fatty acid hydroxylase superfamily)